jgi:hypothetical protein
MWVQVETLPSARALEPTFWLAGHSGALRCSPFRLKDRLRWMSRLACQPFNCGTSPEPARIRRSRRPINDASVTWSIHRLEFLAA